MEETIIIYRENLPPNTNCISLKVYVILDINSVEGLVMMWFDIKYNPYKKFTNNLFRFMSNRLLTGNIYMERIIYYPKPRIKYLRKNLIGISISCEELYKIIFNNIIFITPNDNIYKQVERFKNDIRQKPENIIKYIRDINYL